MALFTANDHILLHIFDVCNRCGFYIDLILVSIICEMTHSKCVPTEIVHIAHHYCIFLQNTVYQTVFF